jgi:hypothetical protein
MKKIYKLNISANVSFKVLINGIEVFTEFNDASIAVDLPINQYLLDNKNLFEVIILNETVLDYTSKNTFEINESDKNGNDFKNIITKEMIINDGEQCKQPTSLELFFIKESDNNILWPSCKILEGNTTEMKLALDALHQIHSAFKTKDLELVLKLLDHRITHLGNAYNRNITNYRALIEEEFSKVITDSTTKLWPLELQQITPCLRAGGKLICFQNDYGDSPLLYYNEKEIISTFFDFHYGILKGENHFSILF